MCRADAIWCSADDAPAIAQAINLLVRDEAVRRRYEEAAARLAAQFDWSNIETRFTEVLQETIREAARNRPERDPLVQPS